MSRRVLLVGTAAVVALACLLVGRSLLVDGPEDRDVFATALPVVDPEAAAAVAARDAAPQDRAVLTRLAEVPTAVWLVPEAYDADHVGGRVRELVDLADEQDRVALLVVYGIPDRDCSGGYSAGGLDAGSYRQWVGRIADEADGAAVVLEPDALASADECADVDERTDLLGDAVDLLAAGDATVYVDAGHSDWVAPDRMAELLEQVGTDHVRGFSTNVSSYQADVDERRYAEAIRDELPDLHYVIDTGRNGKGPGAPGDFCNPAGRALGREPAAGDGALDAWLWIKPPGESDGTCRGGPAAGTFWVLGALELAYAAGWDQQS